MGREVGLPQWLDSAPREVRDRYAALSREYDHIHGLRAWQIDARARDRFAEVIREMRNIRDIFRPPSQATA